MTLDYLIAGRRIRIERAETLSPDGRGLPLRAFVPFAVRPEPAEQPALLLRPSAEIPAPVQLRELHRFPFEDADAECSFGRCTGGYLFRMTPRDGRPATFFKPLTGPEVLSDIAWGGPPDPTLLRFGLWMCLGMAFAPQGILAIHSSAIRLGDEAVLFLGESGTGKSTHTRLWRNHIPGAELLNDDSPLVGMHDGRPTAWGSPWSGKTPCYRSERATIRAFVRLRQAPHNRIRRLSPLAAIGALLPSCAPSFAYDGALQDAVCTALSDLLAAVPVYELECLPDPNAARLAHATLFTPAR